MASNNINRVIITGNLTKDPHVGSIPNSDTAVCNLRIACNGRRKTGEGWVDAPNYFDVTVWGAQGENCAKYLTKGRPVAIDGRLRWREWTNNEGQKRQTVDIIAESVQFLGSGSREDTGGGNGYSGAVRPTESDVPIDTGDFESAPVSSGAADEDIPF